MDEMNCIFPEKTPKEEHTPVPTDALVELPGNLQKKLQLHMEKYCKGMTPRQKKRYMLNKFNIVLKER